MLDEVKKRLRLMDFIGAGAVAALLVGTAAFGIRPMWMARQHSIQQTAELSTRITQLNEVTLQVARIQEQQKSRAALLKEAEARLPSVASVNQFYPDLGKVAEEAGLQVNNVVPAKDLKDAGDYKLLSVEVSGSGDWETCYKFLTGLRAPNRKLTRLDGLRLEVNREKMSVEHPVCQLTVDISTFLAR